MDGTEKTLDASVMDRTEMPTMLSGTVELFTFAPPPVYVMHGVGHIPVKSKLQN